jgi:Putative zinc-finger
MIENGSSGGAGPVRPSESHDEFLELCAIATTGLLSGAEQRRLDEHLLKCPACREAKAQYEALISGVIPAMAPESSPADPLRESSGNSTDYSPDWSVDRAESELFRRLDADEAPSDDRHRGIGPALPGNTERSVAGANLERKASSAPGDLLWRHVWWQYAAGLILVATLGISMYRVGIERGSEDVQRRSPVAPPSPSAPPGTDSRPKQSGEQTSESDALVTSLRTQLASKAAEVAELKAQQTQLEKTLNERDADRDLIAQDRAELGRKLDAAQVNLLAVQQKLAATSAVASRDSQDATQLASLQSKVAELSTSLHDRDEEVSRDLELLEHDRDIRDLMGSRDLLIADVYDVAKTGVTQKPFGRVFYTKGKSLVFYAYDLDRQPGVKDASIFQAWGRRGPDRGHAVNLGIFYQDNAAKKRWVVKSTNPNTLAQIDGVFVTVEPSGGSSHPSTSPLLFAYLRTEPNHP